MNSGALRGFGGKALKGSRPGSALPRNDGGMSLPVLPFERPRIVADGGISSTGAKGEYTVAYTTGRTSDISCGVTYAVASPFYAHPGLYVDMAFRFHSATSAGIVYASIWTWDPALKYPTASVQDLQSKTSFGVPGTHFWYAMTSSQWQCTAEGWYCLVLHPTGETCTFQAGDAVPTSTNAGTSVSNNPANGSYKSHSAITGATYVTSWPVPSSDGEYAAPLIRAQRVS